MKQMSRMGLESEECVTNPADSGLFPALTVAVSRITELLSPTGTAWLLGGSCGLALQGVEIGAQPRDLDVYVDAPEAEIAARSLAEYAVDEQELNCTDMYTSILSHYELDGVQVELVGGFQVRTSGSQYAVEASYLRRTHPEIRTISGGTLALMPLAHELLFNILRGRPDRYEAIAEVMNRDIACHLPVLQDIIARHTWSEETSQQIAKLMPDCLIIKDREDT
ncbi:hypothetical protein [Paenibacillus sp. FJAT-26967]|uniref:hypothetical protein n=1 Tax=Paenibacillus sp. FJAT-26967 TaxID=1729690 RepID=UPI000838D528|nr:hypothetical protein [Paenibacillus sp. FJAT-26967]